MDRIISDRETRDPTKIKLIQGNNFLFYGFEYLKLFIENTSNEIPKGIF